MSDTSAKQELAATICSLARFHKSSADRRTSAEFVIAALRDLGQHPEADKLERLVVRVRAQRANSP